MGLEFFERLSSDAEFCETLGKVTLAAGRFESDLRAYLRLRGVAVKTDATLGHLISALKKHELISENGVDVMRRLKRQRNYLTHSLFDLHSRRIDESILARERLVPGDVSYYSEKARELEQNLSGLTRLVEAAIARAIAGGVAESGGVMLFRP